MKVRHGADITYPQDGRHFINTNTRQIKNVKRNYCHSDEKL